MSPRVRILLAGLILLAAGFLALLVRLFIVRYDFGDVYPEYSSLRCDPLGTAAIYESLTEAPAGPNGAKLYVDRNYHPFHKLAAGPDLTILLLGTDYRYVDRVAKKELKALEKFVADGGRLAITFLPGKAGDHSAERTATAPATLPAGMPQTSSASDNSDSWYEDNPLGELGKSDDMISLANRWGFATDTSGLDVKSTAEPAPNFSFLPGTPWRSSTFFSYFAKPWRVVYRCDGRPVVIERRIGQGTVVLSTDSFFASNEALKNNHSAALIVWLMGQSRSVIFDETHLGVSQETGIADLARQYDLGGVLLGLVVLAGLYIWKGMVRLVPLRSKTQNKTGTYDVVEGRTSGQGLTQLLRRAVDRKKLLDACLEEWEKAVPIIGISDEKINRLRKELPHVNSADPISGYKMITGIIKERK